MTSSMKQHDFFTILPRSFFKQEAKSLTEQQFLLLWPKTQID
nr:MAG TPA: hypothetical protein [Caudoviricetes sp.]